jgi:hypothetical protein
MILAGVFLAFIESAFGYPVTHPIQHIINGCFVLLVMEILDRTGLDVKIFSDYKKEKIDEENKTLNNNK